jgi:hypothetical protein
MPASTSTRPARHPWLTWAASVLFIAAAIAALFVSRWMSRPQGLPPTRQHSGRTEVFLRNPHAWDGEWLPLVETTSSPLLYLVHDDLPPLLCSPHQRRWDGPHHGQCGGQHASYSPGRAGLARLANAPMTGRESRKTFQLAFHGSRAPARPRAS